VTDIVEYNLLCLNRNSLAMSFFFLSEKDPEQGFPCDLTSVAGCSEGIAFEPDNPDHLRLLLGSHLARHVRTKLEEDFGFTSTCGISTNKVLSKLVGAKNKPRNQTTLLALDGDQVSAFMDSHALRRVPGIGFKMACMIESRVTSKAILDDSHTFESNVTVGEARASNKISPSALEALLAGPGAEKGVGARIWGLLHGVDPTEVKEFSDVPSQISIEDTYSGLQTQERITDELYKLACSLLRRMRIDLLVDDVNAEESGVKKWLARPRTLRLSVRSWPESGKMTSQSYNRVSRSAALPGFVFDTKLEISQIVDRLVPEALLPLLRRLEAEKGQKWNLQLINICVANMVAGSSENKKGAGRDIANMFKRQDEVLRPWKVIQDQRDMDEKAAASSGSASDDSETEETWETSENAVCPVCNCLMPSFAMKAHMRYHDMED
jgi:DNA polymerase iota